MKTILVPTDFSKNAENALEYAIKLAQKEKASILLLHAFYDMYISSDVPVEFQEEENLQVQENANNLLKDLCSKVEKTNHVKCEYINKEGLIVNTILETVTNKKVDLVVMGTKGATGFKEFFIGSNTAKVIGNVTCPVIAVPEKAPFNGFGKIVFASDYHVSDTDTIKQLVEIFKVFKSKIIVVHIVDGENTFEYEEEYMKQYIEKIKKQVNYKSISHQLLYSTDIENKLEQFLKKEEVNLLALSTKHKSLFEKLFSKSITQKLAYHSKEPLIAFHHR